MDRLPQLSNEDQLWIMNQVKDGKMTVDQAEYVAQEGTLTGTVPIPAPAPATAFSPTSSQKKKFYLSSSGSSMKSKGFIKSKSSFFGEGKVKDIPEDTISAPIIPIHGGAAKPSTTFDQSFRDMKKKGDEERLKILELVKSGQMTIDDALKYADDAGLSSSAQREADTIADTTSAVLEQKVYNFPVYKSGKIRAQVRKIIQIDFRLKTICCISRGSVTKKYEFYQTTGYETDEGVHFTILFHDDHDMDYDADSPEERLEICRLISIILKLNKADIRTELDYWRELPGLQVVMKEGELEKKGGGGPVTLWTKRWVRVRRGECSYYRPGEEVALNIVQLAEGTTAITKMDENAFILIGKVKQYVFRVPAGDRSVDQQRWERDQWIKVLLEASHNEVVRPSGKLDFVRSDEPQPTPATVTPALTYQKMDQLLQRLMALRTELQSLNVTNDVISRVDVLLKLTGQMKSAPEAHHAHTGHSPHHDPDDTASLRFIPPETKSDNREDSITKWASISPASTYLPATVGLVVPNRPAPSTPAPSFPPPKSLRKILHEPNTCAETPIDDSHATQGIDHKSKSEALLPENVNDERSSDESSPPSQLPAKPLSGGSSGRSPSSEDRLSNFSRLSLTSSRISDQHHLHPVKDFPPRPVRGSRKEKPILAAESISEKSYFFSPNEPISHLVLYSHEAKPEMRSTDVSIQALPVCNDECECEQLGTESVKSDHSDGKVSDYVEELEEKKRQEEQEAKKRTVIPAGHVIEMPQGMTVIAAPPPAPLIPPPPPLIGGGPGKSKKLKRASNSRLKPIHWDKVPKNLYLKSVWKHANDLTDVLDHALLDEMFADEKVKSSNAVATTSPPEKKVRTLLDPKRAQNLAIILTGLKMTVPQLQDKLNLIHDGALPLEQISMLRRLQPTVDDVEMYKAYRGDPEELEPADKFLLKLSEVPQLSIRLDILNDIMELPIQYKDLEPSVCMLQRALRELLETAGFVRVLEYVLAIGNYLNSGAGKPAVDGFQLASLNKICDLRGSKDRNFTVLHYLVQFLVRHDPDLLHFYKGMSHVTDCTELSIAGLSAEVEVMKGYLQKIQKRAKSLRKIRSTALENKFQQDVQSFVAEYGGLLKVLHDQCNDVASKFKKVMEYYGEPADRASEEIFPPLARFFFSFQRVLRETEKKNETPA